MKNVKMSFAVVLALSTIAIVHGQDDKQKEIHIQNEKTVNTALLDFSPAFYEDGIVYVSSQMVNGKEKVYDEQIGRKTMSIFRAKRGTDGKLMKPEAFANELVSLFHEGPLTFDKTGETVFFTRNNNNGKKANYTKGIARLKIYMARKEGGKWSEATELPFNENESDAAHPSVSVDGDRLYFTSNRAGGYGGMDIYVCERMGDTWGKPTNLGPKINTTKNDVFPFVHPDGTLFYSSDGLGGRGGLDLFYTKPSTLGGFEVPKSLGLQFNTDKDDFGLIVDVDMKNGYFASSRNGGQGEDDIYSFSITNGRLMESFESEELSDCNRANSRHRLLDLVVIDRKTGKPIPEATINFANMDDMSLSEIITDMKIKNTPLLNPDGTITLQTLENKSTSKLTDSEGRLQLKIIRSGNYVIEGTKTSYNKQQIIYKNGDIRNPIIILLDQADPCIHYSGVVVKADDGKPIPKAIVSIVNAKGELQTIKADEDGKFSGCMQCNSNYKMSATLMGITSQWETVSTTGMDCDKWQAFDRPIELKINISDNDLANAEPRIVEGTIFRLKNIYYNFNDASIRPDAHKDLDAVAAMMLKYPDMEIELSSHTDSRGSNSFNKDLSQNRANNAAQYLFIRGIEAQRVKAVGYGENRLLNYCADGTSCSEQEHSNNRRTEVRILKSGSSSGKVYTEATDKGTH